MRRKYKLLLVLAAAMVAAGAIGALLTPVAVRAIKLRTMRASIERKLVEWDCEPDTEKKFNKKIIVEEEMEEFIKAGGVNAGLVKDFLDSREDSLFEAGLIFMLKLSETDAASLMLSLLETDGLDRWRKVWALKVLTLRVQDASDRVFGDIFRRFVFDADIELRSAATFGVFKCLGSDAVPLLKESVSRDLRLEYAVREIRTTGPPGGRSAATYLGFLFCEDIENFLAAEAGKPHCPEVCGDILKVLYENGSPKAFRFCLEHMDSEKDDLAWTWMMRTVMRHGSLEDRVRIIRSVRSMPERRQIAVARHVRDHGTEREQFEMCVEAIMSEEVAENIRMFFLDEDRLEALIDKIFHCPETRVRDTRVLHSWGRRMVEEGILKID
ncbi:MAG: hypothetical protein N3A38_11490 [Planctomycetota bacterium]|nr:hypothetical protein [Planctomycetota bacterium]